MTDIQFTTFLSEIQPISLSFYLDQYNLKEHQFNGQQMKAGKYVVEIDGTCHYTELGSSFNIVLNVMDSSSNYIDITSKQYKDLKITVLKNIVTNGRKHTATVQSA
tara:strand:+ start:8010 stop:8327 length:318 start_codon:yes stop_codon:yes gene_type:complete